MKGTSDMDKPRYFYKVCGDCSHSLVNDDWTWIDGLCGTPAETEEEFQSMAANVEAMGNVVCDWEHFLDGGYFTCWVCDSAVLGGFLWEQVAK